MGSRRVSLARGRPAVFGEVLFDEFPGGKRVLGGAPFNVGWHLRGFGADPMLVTAVGFDKPGHDVLRRMEEWGLATEGVQIDGLHPTGHVRVVPSDGDNRFEIEPEQAWDFIAPGPARSALREPVRLLYHGTLALRGVRSWKSLMAVAQPGIPTFVDLNLRDPWSAPDRVRWALSTARWLKLNAEELRTVTSKPTDTVEACESAARALAGEHEIERVFVTRGSSGALCVTAGGDLVTAEGPPIEDIVDTVGAGDAFSAVLCLSILGGWGTQMALDRAVRFAGDVCRIPGATTGDPSLYEGHLRAWSEGRDPRPADDGPEGLYIMSLSLHGLVRGIDIELGRDPDTGGQVSYVVDEARALVAREEVSRVDVITRQVHDRRVDESYAVPFEALAPGAQIVRLPFGPRRYLRKESLWPHLDSLLDELARYLRRSGRIPDLIHGHYADAGYVGAALAKLLGVPFFFTGHSLGRVKRRRLLAGGSDEETLEDRYRMAQRIEAEEQALETAAIVIASTHQEVEEQYQLYDHYAPEGMRVIPPGVDLDRYSPAPDDWGPPPIAQELDRFLDDPERPMVLALARPDERKNFEGLIEAFGGSALLRERANLVLVAGTRDDIGKLPANPRTVLTRMLLLIDEHDLYGRAAYPKAHATGDIPDLYRLAARTGGVFVNPAFTEPFGLTLLEAAASGLPIVATDDGGPRDILSACRNGLLVDATDPVRIAEGIEEALASRDRWEGWARQGIEGVHKNFSWSSHAERYLDEVKGLLGGIGPGGGAVRGSRLPVIDRLLVTDIDDTLTGDEAELRVLIERLVGAGGHVGFGIATGRTLERALETIDQLGIPVPDVLITATGTQLHYGERLIRDRSWERQIHHRWEPDLIRQALGELDGLELDIEERQTAYRIRYRLDPDHALSPSDLLRHLRQSGLRATTILDHGRFLDVIPVRASPGMAIRFLCFKWDLPPDRLLVAGDSGNDADMLSGETLGVVVGNHTDELEGLRGRHRVYFAERGHAGGVLEGMAHYRFLDEIRPDREPPE